MSKYINQYLKAIKQSNNNSDTAIILDKLYNDGFTDGTNNIKSKAKIKITHIGQDYATIKVNSKEYQVSLELGLHLLRYADKKSTINLN